MTKYGGALGFDLRPFNGLPGSQPEWQILRIADEDRQAMLEQICYGALSRKDIKTREVWPTVKSWLNPGLLAVIDKEVPERYELPGGRRAKIAYSETAGPNLEVATSNSSTKTMP